MSNLVPRKHSGTTDTTSDTTCSTGSTVPVMLRWAGHIRGQPSGNRGPLVRSEKEQLPMLHVPHTIENTIIAVVGEFVGTFMFLFFAFAGGQVSNTPKPPSGSLPNTSNLLYLSLSFGFSLLINVWTFYRVTGGLFNPVVFFFFFFFFWSIYMLSHVPSSHQAVLYVGKNIDNN